MIIFSFHFQLFSFHFRLSFYISIIFCLPGTWLLWQRAKQHIPEVPLLRNTLQLQTRDPVVFLGLGKYAGINSPDVRGLSWGVLPIGCALLSPKQVVIWMHPKHVRNHILLFVKGKKNNDSTLHQAFYPDEGSRCGDKTRFSHLNPNFFF